MKKLVVILLAAILALPVFYGCDRNKEEYLDVDIIIWHYYNDRQKTAFDNYVTQFNAEVGITRGIRVVAVAKGKTNDLANAVISSARGDLHADTMPDMFLTYPDTAKTIDKLGEGGNIAALDQYFTTAELGEYVQGFLDEGRIDATGKIKNFPIAKSSEILLVNKTIWDEFAADTGVTADKLATMEGVIEVSEEYYNWSGGKAFYGRDSMANYFIVGAKQLGIDLFSNDASDNLVVNTDKTVMRKLWDSYYVPYLKGYFAASGDFRTDDMRLNPPKIVGGVGSSPSASYVDTIDCMVLPAPGFKDGGNYSFQQGAGFSVTANANEKMIKGCVEFLKWFTEPERNIKFSLLTNYIPVKRTALDWSKFEAAIAADSALNKTDNVKKGLQVSINIAKESTMYVNKPFVNGNSARNALDAALSKANLNTKREAILDTVQDNPGMTEEEALAGFISDEIFDDWYNSLVTALSAFAA